MDTIETIAIAISATTLVGATLALVIHRRDQRRRQARAQAATRARRAKAELTPMGRVDERPPRRRTEPAISAGGLDYGAGAAMVPSDASVAEPVPTPKAIEPVSRPDNTGLMARHQLGQAQERIHELEQEITDQGDLLVAFQGYVERLEWRLRCGELIPDPVLTLLNEYGPTSAEVMGETLGLDRDELNTALAKHVTASPDVRQVDFMDIEGGKRIFYLLERPIREWLDGDRAVIEAELLPMNPSGLTGQHDMAELAELLEDDIWTS